MKFHLNRKVRFIGEVEYRSLYQWALQEITSDGKVVGGDQIPWMWTLNFIATGIRLVRNIKAQGDGTEAEDSESIQTELAAYDRRGHPPRFSMFGTDRIIKDFSLTIQPAGADRPVQSCIAWGFVSYTTEERETAPDTIGFEVSLPAAQFDSLKQTLLHGAGDHSILFSAHRVSGFYSQWSPDIFTSQVKVLTANNEHDVALPPNIEGVPRLGEVGEFTILLARRPAASPWTPGLDEQASEETERPAPRAEDAEPSSQANAGLELLAEIKRLQRSVMSLRLPIWLLLLVAAIAVLK